MATLNQTDLNVRLQRIRCCIASKGATLVDKIKMGSKDVHCKLQELQVIEGMFEAIKCWNIEDSEVLATGEIDVVKLEPGDSVQVFIGGVAVTPIITSVGGGEVNMMTNIKNYINAGGIYTASYPAGPRNASIVIRGTCANEPITIEFEGDPTSVITISGLSGGFCGLNCLTEVEVQAMIDYIATRCDLCFKDPGFDYES